MHLIIWLGRTMRWPGGSAEATVARERATLHHSLSGELADKRPIRSFGVFDCASEKLIGSIEANLAYRLVPGQVNISYGVFPGWRRKGIARRALEVMGSYLKHATDVRQMVLRIECANEASRRMAERCGFRIRRDF